MYRPRGSSLPFTHQLNLFAIAQKERKSVEEHDYFGFDLQLGRKEMGLQLPSCRCHLLPVPIYAEKKKKLTVPICVECGAFPNVVHQALFSLYMVGSDPKDPTR